MSTETKKFREKQSKGFIHWKSSVLLAQKWLRPAKPQRSRHGAAHPSASHKATGSTGTVWGAGHNQHTGENSSRTSGLGELLSWRAAKMRRQMSCCWRWATAGQPRSAQESGWPKENQVLVTLLCWRHYCSAQCFTEGSPAPPHVSRSSPGLWRLAVWQKISWSPGSWDASVCCRLSLHMRIYGTPTSFWVSRKPSWVSHGFCPHLGAELNCLLLFYQLAALFVAVCSFLKMAGENPESTKAIK